MNPSTVPVQESVPPDLFRCDKSGCFFIFSLEKIA